MYNDIEYIFFIKVFKLRFTNKFYDYKFVQSIRLVLWVWNIISLVRAMIDLKIFFMFFFFNTQRTLLNFIESFTNIDIYRSLNDCRGKMEKKILILEVSIIKYIKNIHEKWFHYMLTSSNLSLSIGSFNCETDKALGSFFFVLKIITTILGVIKLQKCYP